MVHLDLNIGGMMMKIDQSKFYLNKILMVLIISFNCRSRECNNIRGAYDGTLFPKNISETEIFNVYRKAFCRILPIKYSHAGRLNGLEAYWFTLAADAFDNDIDDTKSSCYCTDNKCLRKGLGNITPCYYSKYNFVLGIENYLIYIFCNFFII